MSVEIREIAKEDMEAIIPTLCEAELYAIACVRRSGLFKTYHQIRHEGNNWVLRMWVAYINDEPAGIACIEKPDYHNKEILNLYVKPWFRSMGIGNQLVTLAKQSGIQFDVYFTSLSKSLYSRHGFSKYLRNFAA